MIVRIVRRPWLYSRPVTIDPVILLDRAMAMALRSILSDDVDVDPMIRPSRSPDLGDYQANFAMSLGRQLGRPPRDIALEVVAAADLDNLAASVEVAGPGFVNITLSNTAISRLLGGMTGEALGVEPDGDEHAIVIDLCGVNIAKQMHVGHLRSTVIGDSLARVFERLGRTVHRENHLGDWGLPIAMVLHRLRASGADLTTITLDDLDEVYRAAQQATCDDEGAIEAAKATLVALQRGDADLVEDWQALVDCTMRGVHESLDLLNTRIGPEHGRGESTYRSSLEGVVEAFTGAGLAVEDDGALVVRFMDRDRPMLIRKSDGGYLYATTDLAAIRRRVRGLGATRVIYVVDARQRDHFRDLFDAVRMIGWDRTGDGLEVAFSHVAFGAVLGADRKPLRTRGGHNVTLRSLLDEAVDRGTAEVVSRSQRPDSPTHGLSEEALASIGRAVGIGAVKYADLGADLVRDYVFDMDRMVAFDGNTGPYLQYAHARICSILGRADGAPAPDASPIPIEDGAERKLALALLRHSGTVRDVARTLEPHRLCTSLYELANAFSAFYRACPVLAADDEATRTIRLRLCDLVRRVLADGLDMLGIEAPRRM